VSGHRAADQPRPKGAEDPHHPQRFDAHLAKVFAPPQALVHARQRLNLVADFAIAGQIAGFDVSAADPPSGLHLRPKILRLIPGVHQPSRLPGDAAT